MCWCAVKKLLTHSLTFWCIPTGPKSLQYQSPPLLACLLFSMQQLLHIFYPPPVLFTFAVRNYYCICWLHRSASKCHIDMLVNPHCIGLSPGTSHRSPSHNACITSAYIIHYTVDRVPAAGSSFRFECLQIAVASWVSYFCQNVKSELQLSTISI